MLEQILYAVVALKEKLAMKNQLLREGHLLDSHYQELIKESQSISFTINLLENQILISADAFGETLRKSVFTDGDLGGVSNFQLKEGFVSLGEEHSYYPFLKEELIHPSLFYNPNTSEVVAWCSINDVLVVGVSDILLINSNCKSTTGWTFAFKEQHS